MPHLLITTEAPALYPATDGGGKWDPKLAPCSRLARTPVDPEKGLQRRLPAHPRARTPGDKHTLLLLSLNYLYCNNLLIQYI